MVCGTSARPAKHRSDGSDTTMLPPKQVRGRYEKLKLVPKNNKNEKNIFNTYCYIFCKKYKCKR
jgi:hypothetical protein